jgi:hypothetical protein
MKNLCLVVFCVLAFMGCNEGFNGKKFSPTATNQYSPSPNPYNPSPSPSPGPAPTPTPTPAGLPPPTGTEPHMNCDGGAIVRAEREKYGSPSQAELLEILRAVARTLNNQNCAQWDFGILRKTGGNNCGGYSCDVICMGQDGNQHQWDVIGDAGGASSPGWGYISGGIRVDDCQVP